MDGQELLNYRPIGMMKEEDAKELTSFLNQTLANEYVLFTKTLNYHWNITGPRFHSIHSFLDESYHELLIDMDNVAERIRMIDETPVSTLLRMSKINTLIETSGEHLSANDMLLDLFASHLKIHEEISDFLNRKVDITDRVTEGFLISLMSKHEKKTWVFKSHLKE